MRAFILLGILLCYSAQAASPTTRTTLDRLEASINSSLILLSDIKRFRDGVRLRAQLDPLFSGTSLASKGEKATQDEITEFLVNERLIAQQFPVADAEVEQEINSIQSGNRLDRTTLKAALAEQGFKFDDYFELIRTSASKRNLIDRDIRTKVNITKDDIKNYFYNHYARNTSAPRAYHLQLITIAVKSYKSPAAANGTATQALRDIKAGESFTEVAKRLNDDGTGPSGGDMGVLAEDQISPVLLEQVKKLQIGQVSGVFGSATTGRFQILKLVDVKSDENDRLARMGDEIRNQLAAAEYQHQISLWLDRQRQSAFIHKAGEPLVKGLPILGK
jgi:peptidyl-prolyl cis-trans isomerase SurA